MGQIELRLELARVGAAMLEGSSLLSNRAKTADRFTACPDAPSSAGARADIFAAFDAQGGQQGPPSGASAVRIPALAYLPEGARRRTEPMVPGLETPLNPGDGAGQAFEMSIERQTWEIKERGAKIEVALELGEVVARDRRSPFCEVSLTLQEGAPSALFALARRMDRIAPLRLSVRTREDRARGLMAAAPAAFRAEPVVLAAEMTVSQAFVRIAWNCLRQYRLNEDILLTEPSEDALHQARVALRRLRSALSIFAPMVGGASQGSLWRNELRQLALVLGEARNLDVLSQRVTPDGDVYDRVQRARGRAYARVQEVLGAAHTRMTVLGLVEWLGDGHRLKSPETNGARGIREFNVRAFAGGALGLYRRKVRKRGRRLQSLTDAGRHEVRKDAKKLRYAAEFFKAVFDRPKESRGYRKFIANLEKLQEKLGDLNDLVMMPGVLRTLDITEDELLSAYPGRASKKRLIMSAAKAQKRFAGTKGFWR